MGTKPLPKSDLGLPSQTLYSVQDTPKLGYDPSHFAALARSEATNFWFKARNKLIISALAKYAKEARTFLEIGCGTGFVLQAIAERFPSLTITGTELFPEGLEFAAKRVPRANLLTLDARELGDQHKYDAIGAFDVIEHIYEDELVLRNLFDALNPNGWLFINVPQHMFLWSRSDELACHYRRYELSEMKRKLESAGFRVISSTSFVVLLLPLMFLSRLIQNKIFHSHSVFSELQINGLPNFVLEQVLYMELALGNLGIRWTMGGSLFVVARKPK